MHVLFYPFHLCHERTLDQLLRDYQTVHFRDFMALQLTTRSGMTAFPDRMGDYYPDRLQTGRIVQGYPVSGPLSQAMTILVNRDLTDHQWRSIFHLALESDRRFQLGLFRPQDEQDNESPKTPNPSLLSTLSQSGWESKRYHVETLQDLSRKRLAGDLEILFDYGMALLKTSASLQYTIQLCRQHNLVAATDSRAHAELLWTTCKRENISLSNHCVSRQGY